MMCFQVRLGICCSQVVWRGYVQSMLQAGFTSELVLYAASGLLTYGASDGMPFDPEQMDWQSRHTQAHAQAAPVMSVLLHSWYEAHLLVMQLAICRLSACLRCWSTAQHFCQSVSSADAVMCCRNGPIDWYTQRCWALQRCALQRAIHSTS